MEASRPGLSRAILHNWGRLCSKLFWDSGKKETTVRSMTPTMPKPCDDAGRLSTAVFGATTLLSAFLLFQMQPLVSKAILPWFGGAPAVWTACMLFFQTLLFAGYLYAHLLQRWLAPRGQVFVQLILVAAALVALPIAPGPEYKPADVSSPTWQILRLLTLKAGLPFFALSATSPLVQAWFSHANPGRSPYRLYALSNAGSLAALLTYPFLFEPALALGQQSALWSWGFAGYAAFCAVIFVGLRTWNRRAVPDQTDLNGNGIQESAWDGFQGATAEPAARAPGWLDRFRWIALPACASLMLLAATNHICQDVAVVPFLWILPLALYLLSFILCFDHPRWYVRPVWAVAAWLALVASAGADAIRFEDHALSLPQEIVLNSAALFFLCMICHGELARLKPDPSHLTGYYLWISAGGALGGLFVALAAPRLFATHAEWPIGLMLSSLFAAGLLILPGLGGFRRWVRYALLLPPVCAGLWYLVHWEMGYPRSHAIEQRRNFFGVVSITEYYVNSPESHHYVLTNGRIAHGCQFADPAKRRWPTSYYGEDSGVGLAIRYFQQFGDARVGAVGLGVGTLAAYARPGDAFRFYEINPEVRRIAEAGRPFTYLKDCRGRCEVVMGDARLSLEREPAQGYHVIALDAFSGDAIPVHLLTREAFELYRRHLAPGGVIAVHISNRYLKLAPVVRRAAEHFGMKTTRIEGEKDEQRLLDPNDWILVTENDAFLQTHPPTSDSFSDDDLTVPLWTDDYSSLWPILSESIQDKKIWEVFRWKTETEETTE